MYINQKVSNSIMKLDMEAVRNNFRIITEKAKKINPNVKVSAVLKSNAYGFGIERICPILIKENCKNFFVTYLNEGLLIKDINENIGIKDYNIFVLSPGIHQQENIDIILANKLIPVLRTIEEIHIYSSLAEKNNKKLPAVIKFDTGMNRFGLKDSDLINLEDSRVLENIDVMYLMSHMCAANIPDSSLNEMQYKSMCNIKSIFPNTPISFGNSYSIFLDKKYSFDMIRVGRLIYGETDSISNNQNYPDIGLKPIISIYSKVLQVKYAKKGEFIGYEGTYRCMEDKKIAIVGIGYSDGYSTLFSNNAFFIVNGKKANVLGKISMEYAVCDITNIENVKEDDIVTIVDNNTITIDRLSKLSGMSSLELIANFCKSIKHIENC